jgi:hypothetical protein
MTGAPRTPRSGEHMPRRDAAPRPMDNRRAAVAYGDDNAGAREA